MPFVSETVQVLSGALAISPSNPMPVLANEHTKATYSIAGVANTPAATPTDVVTLFGAAGKTVKIKKVVVTGVATTAGTMNVLLTKHTAANTGGTSTAPTIAKYNTSTAASATPALYTANPTTLGASAALAAGALNFGLAGAAGTVTFDFANRNSAAPTLSSATEGIAINLNGEAVPAGGKFGYYIEFEEV